MKTTKEQFDWMRQQEILVIGDVSFVRKDKAIQVITDMFRDWSIWKLIYCWWQCKRKKGAKKLDITFKQG